MKEEGNRSISIARSWMVAFICIGMGLMSGFFLGYFYKGEILKKDISDIIEAVSADCDQFWKAKILNLYGEVKEHCQCQ